LYFLSSFQLRNIASCLTFLRSCGVELDGIEPRDIAEGNLRSILGLFFALSKHKQHIKHQQKIANKQQHQPPAGVNGNVNATSSSSKLPVQGHQSQVNVIAGAGDSSKAHSSSSTSSSQAGHQQHETVGVTSGGGTGRISSNGNAADNMLLSK
jgi:hypothetical protein